MRNSNDWWYFREDDDDDCCTWGDTGILWSKEGGGSVEEEILLERSSECTDGRLLVCFSCFSTDSEKVSRFFEKCLPFLDSFPPILKWNYWLRVSENKISKTNSNKYIKKNFHNLIRTNQTNIPLLQYSICGLLFWFFLNERECQKSQYPFRSQKEGNILLKSCYLVLWKFTQSIHMFKASVNRDVLFFIRIHYLRFLRVGFLERNDVFASVFVISGLCCGIRFWRRGCLRGRNNWRWNQRFK
jgi:hypothetical protein